MFTRPIVIREATPADTPFLQAMIWEAILASPTFLARHGSETMQRAEEQYWQKWPEHPDPAFIALDASGQKLGAITLKRDDATVPTHSWRIGIGVEAQARGQGIGRRLIEQAILYARTREAHFVTLLVDPTNTPALTLYQHMGFVQVKANEQDHMLKMQIQVR